MNTFDLNKTEIAWLKRLEKTMAAAPKGIGEKVAAYTIGDYDITLFHEKTYDEMTEHFRKQGLSSIHGEKDVCTQVVDSDSEIIQIKTPFAVWSTSG